MLNRIAQWWQRGRSLGESGVFERLMRPTIDQTLAEFHAFPEENLRAESITARRIISEYRDNKRKRPDSWEEMFQLELVLLQILPDDVLRHRAAIVAAKYEAAGLPKLPPLADDASPQAVRSRAEAMTSELQWCFRKGLELQFAAGRLRGTVFRDFAVMALTLLAVSAIAHAANSDAKPVSIVFLCMLMGLVGSFASILRRLTLDGGTGVGRPAHYSTVTELDTGAGSVSLALFSGVIFGLLAFLLMLSGILSVEGLTPKLPADCSGAAISCALPAKELAKLLVWCFLAGFAEKLVPDVLDKLAGKATGTEKPAAAAGNGKT